MEQQENRAAFESVKMLKINKDYLHYRKFETLTKKNILKQYQIYETLDSNNNAS